MGAGQIRRHDDEQQKHERWATSRHRASGPPLRRSPIIPMCPFSCLLPHRHPAGHKNRSQNEDRTEAILNLCVLCQVLYLSIILRKQNDMRKSESPTVQYSGLTINMTLNNTNIALHTLILKGIVVASIDLVF